MTVEYLVPVVPSSHMTCACCGSNNSLHLKLDTVMHDGWFLLKDGETVQLHDHKKTDRWEDFPKVRAAEKLAKKDPDHDWRIWYIMAFHGGTYQRQNGKWVLVEQNEGYA